MVVAEFIGRHHILHVDEGDPILIAAPLFHPVVDGAHIARECRIEALGDGEIVNVRIRHPVVHEREQPLQIARRIRRRSLVVIEIIRSQIDDERFGLHGRRKNGILGNRRAKKTCPDTRDT